MATWTTILRDLAKTAMVAAGRAAQSSRRTNGSNGSSGSSGTDGSSGRRITMPDLATVDDVHAARDAADDPPATGEPDQPRRAEPDQPRRAEPDQPRRAEPVAPPEPLDRPMRPSTGGDRTGGDRNAADAPAANASDPDVPAPDDPGRDRRRQDRDEDGVSSPGQLGPAATVEVDPADLDLVRTEYNPDTDGDPDPGEIVWTWVPYEERDGRGKDRPVLVVARLADDAVLAVQLSSRDHDGDRGWQGLGAGDWDGEHRESWANLDRILLVHPDGLRREAASLDRERFDRVAHVLRDRYRWS